MVDNFHGSVANRFLLALNILFTKTNKQRNKLRGLSASELYRLTIANCWQNLLPTFADRGVSRGQRGGSPTVINLSFLDRNCYFYFKQLLIYPQEAEWTPFQTHCYSENLVAPGMEPGISGSAARKSYHYTTEAVILFTNYRIMNGKNNAVYSGLTEASPYEGFKFHLYNGLITHKLKEHGKISQANFCRQILYLIGEGMKVY
jgi:hypothetical protein